MRSVRFGVNTMNNICKVSPHLLPSGVPRCDPFRRGKTAVATAQPGPASHSLTDPDRSTCYACAATDMTRCWHWLACDVQVQYTLTEAVVRIIARAQDVPRCPNFEIIPSSFSLRARHRRTIMELRRAKLDESRRGSCRAQAPMPAPPDIPASHRAPKWMGCTLPHLPA